MNAVHTGRGQRAALTKRWFANRSAWLYDPVINLVTSLAGGKGQNLYRPVITFADLKPGQRVLDIACGSGELVGLMAEKVGQEGMVVGVDLACGMLQLAQDKMSSPWTGFCLASADAVPYPCGYFDRVTITFSLHHMPRQVRERSLHEIHRLLAPGGRAVIVDLTWPKNQMGHVLFWLLVRIGSRTAFDMLSSDLSTEVKADAWARVWRGAGYRFGQVLLAEK